MSDSLEIVIVLYECLLEESISFTSLQRQLKDIKVDYELVIFNNDENRVMPAAQPTAWPDMRGIPVRTAIFGRFHRSHHFTT